MAGVWVGPDTSFTKEPNAGVKNMVRLPKLSLTVSHPILHDIIKSCLVYEAKEIFTLCSKLPQLKRSRIFLPGTPHKFEDARQEWFAGGVKYPADAVWRFKAYENMFPSYYIIHEIKTGHYDITTEMAKHYIKHNHVSFYIWAYPRFHAENKYVPKSFVKMLDINVLKPVTIPKVNTIMQNWGWHCGE